MVSSTSIVSKQVKYMYVSSVSTYAPVESEPNIEKREREGERERERERQ